MRVTIELPEDIAKKIEQKVSDLSRYTLESLAIEGYRTERLSRGEVGRILSLNWWEVEALLKAANAELHYTQADLEQDRATLKRLKTPQQPA